MAQPTVTQMLESEMRRYSGNLNDGLERLIKSLQYAKDRLNQDVPNVMDLNRNLVGRLAELTELAAKFDALQSAVALIARADSDA